MTIGKKKEVLENDKWTTIKIRIGTVKKLSKYRSYPNESYESIIKRYVFNSALKGVKI